MNVLTILLLVIAGLCTALMVPIVVSLKTLNGQDAMGLVLVFAVMAVRWASLAGAVFIAGWRGAWAWAGPGRGAQSAAVLAFHALAGGASFGAIVMAAGPDSAAIKVWAFVFALGMPMATIVAVAVTLMDRKDTVPLQAWRAGAGVMLILMAWGGMTMWRVERARTADNQQQTAALEAERARDHEEKLAALKALSPAAPLADWLPWLDVSDDRILTPARETVRARPTLNADLAAMLRGPDAVRALRYIWLWMPDAQPELAEPVRDAIASLPAWATQYLDAHPPGTMVETQDDSVFPPQRKIDLSSACESAVVVALYYRKQGVDLEAPMRRLSETLAERAMPNAGPGEDPTQTCRDFLQYWATEHTK